MRETKQVYLQITNGLFVCCDAATGEIKWEHSLMETIGRITFPNGRTGAPDHRGRHRHRPCHHLELGRRRSGQRPALRFRETNRQTGLVRERRPAAEGQFPFDAVCRNALRPARAVRRHRRRELVRVQRPDGRAALPVPAFKDGSRLLASGGRRRLVGIHNDENIDTSESGRIVAVKLPAEIPAKQADPTKTDGTPLAASAEAWRHPFGSFTSSPTVFAGRVYQLTQTGLLLGIELATGKLLFEQKIAEDNLHSSPLFVDGLLYCPVKGGARAGGGSAGYVHVFKVTKEGVDSVGKLEVDGEANAQPAVAGGKLYVHTRKQLYCYQIGGGKITAEALPKSAPLVAGKPAALRIVPQEVLLEPGQTATFRIESIDANGAVVGPASGVKWESYIPPTARVRATADAAFNAKGELVAGQKTGGGAFKATSADGLSGIIRCRVIPALAQKQDFEAFEVTEAHVTETGSEIRLSHRSRGWAPDSNGRSASGRIPPIRTSSRRSSPKPWTKSSSSAP